MKHKIGENHAHTVEIRYDGVSYGADKRPGWSASSWNFYQGLESIAAHQTIERTSQGKLFATYW